jgi:hypothetical protein
MVRLEAFLFDFLVYFIFTTFKNLLLQRPLVPRIMMFLSIVVFKSRLLGVGLHRPILTELVNCVGGHS